MTKRSAKYLNKEKQHKSVRNIPMLVRYLRYGNKTENNDKTTIWRSKSLISKALCLPLKTVEKVLNGGEIDEENFAQEFTRKKQTLTKE